MKYSISVVIEVDSLEAAAIVRDTVEEALSDIDVGQVIKVVRYPVEDSDE